MCPKLTVLQKKMVASKSLSQLSTNINQRHHTIGLSSDIQVRLLVLSLAALHDWMTTEFED